jgi:hypothetical protein
VTRHSLAWLIAIIAIMLFAPLMVGQEAYERTMAVEFRYARQWYGDPELQKILDRTDRIYSAIMVKTGVDPLIRKHGTKPIQHDDISARVENSQAMSPYAAQIRDYWQNFLYNIWMFCFRLSHSWLWCGYLLPFLFALIFDGLMTRKAKLASFKYTSPTVYNLSWHIIIALAACSAVAFAIVEPLPFFAYPAVLTAMGVMVRLLISNIQHSA